MGPKTAYRVLSAVRSCADGVATRPRSPRCPQAWARHPQAHPRSWRRRRLPPAPERITFRARRGWHPRAAWASPAMAPWLPALGAVLPARLVAATILWLGGRRRRAAQGVLLLNEMVWLVYVFAGVPTATLLACAVPAALSSLRMAALGHDQKSMFNIVFRVFCALRAVAVGTVRTTAEFATTAVAPATCPRLDLAGRSPGGGSEVSPWRRPAMRGGQGQNLESEVASEGGGPERSASQERDITRAATLSRRHAIYSGPMGGP